jgi:hypothetical protein
MSFLSNLSFSTSIQNQAEILQAETAHRSQLVEGLQQVQTRFTGLVTEIEKANRESAELLQQLKPSQQPTAELQAGNEDNNLETLSKLVSLVLELKRAESLDRLYPKIAELKTEARGIEAEAIKLDTEIQSLKEITAKMRALIAQRKETTQLAKESQSLIISATSKV